PIPSIPAGRQPSADRRRDAMRRHSAVPLRLLPLLEGTAPPGSRLPDDLDAVMHLAHTGAVHGAIRRHPARPAARHVAGKGDLPVLDPDVDPGGFDSRVPEKLVTHGLPDPVIGPAVARRAPARRLRLGGKVRPEVRLAGASVPERGAAIPAPAVLLVLPPVVPAPWNPALVAPLLTRHRYCSFLSGAF